MGSRHIKKIALGDAFKFGNLRSLNDSDAEGMLQWMHDASINKWFRYDFSAMTRSDALSFIRSSWTNEVSLHFAISGGTDDSYYGTVSLKNIDQANLTTEYAIATPSYAHGTGSAFLATKSALNFAFSVLGLNRVYLDVRADNARAVSFYRKVGFVKEGIAREAFKCTSGEFVDLIWLSMLKRDYCSTASDLNECVN